MVSLLVPILTEETCMAQRETGRLAELAGTSRSSRAELQLS